MRKILAEYRLPGFSVQDVSYCWSAEAELHDIDSTISLKYASRPGPIQARAWSSTGTELSVGRMALMPPDAVIPARALRDEPDLRATIVKLNHDWFNELLEPPMVAQSARISMDLDFQNIVIENSLARLSSELAQPGLASRAMVQALVSTLAVDLARHLERQNNALHHDGGTLSPRRLRHIRQFISDCPIGVPMPREVASECGISSAHLRRLFKNTTGQTLQSYIEGVRMEKACALLRQLSAPLKVISHRAGFVHYSAFAAAFKRSTGETPQEYRQRWIQHYRNVPH